MCDCPPDRYDWCTLYKVDLPARLVEPITAACHMGLTVADDDEGEEDVEPLNFD